MSRDAAKKTTTLLVAALTFGIFAGCPTPPKAPPRVTPLERVQVPVPEPVLPAEPVDQELTVAPVMERPESLIPEDTLDLPFGYIAVENWYLQCGFEEARRNAAGDGVLLTGNQRTMSLVVNNRFARWNGINVALGFLPVVDRSHLKIHSLDVVKNIYPLMQGSLAFAPDDMVLVLDPGHGGRDTGSQAVGRNAFEKDLTLDWARRIERLLAGSAWKVVLTRRDDRELTLLDRVAVADAAGADLFISLHFNSLPANAGALTESGIETYCVTPAGMNSTLTRGYEDDTRKVFPNNHYDADNLVLASRLHQNLLNVTGRPDRGIRRARFMTVIREQRRPSVLLEAGYLSHPAESRLILQEQYRERLAQAVVRSLSF